MKKSVLIKSIRKAYDNALKKGLVTDDTYFRRVETFVNEKVTEKVKELGHEKYYDPRFWKGSWAEEWIEEKILDYQNGDIAAKYVESCVFGITRFSEMVRDEQILGTGKKAARKVRVGLRGNRKDGTGFLGRLAEEGVSDDKNAVTSIKPSKGNPELRKIIDHLDQVIPKTDPNYRTTIALLCSQYFTGGRINAEVNLKAKDIDLEKMTKKYDRDKHKFTRRTPIDEEFRGFFETLTQGKKEGADVFRFVRKDGTDMSRTEKVKYVQEKLREASIFSGVNYLNEDGVEMRYTTHSNRRAYAQREIDKTKKWNREKTINEIGKYLNLQGSNKEKIIKRIQNEKDHINWRNKRNGKPMRTFMDWELKLLYVSLRLGHSRIEITRRYIHMKKKG